MKLDPRIIEGKKPLTCFDVEEAKQFLGKECYFSNCKCHYKKLDDFKRFVSLSDYCIGVLTAVMNLGDRVFDVDQQCKEFRYCLPCEWVKEKEPKKYRPYKNYDEMSQDFSVGQIIDYIDKDFNCIHQAEIVEAFTNSAGETYVGIGRTYYALSAWFESIEVKDPETDQWVPFGSEE